MYLNRDIEKSLLEAGKSFPAIVLYGSRQVGKSTTVSHLFGKKFRIVTLDDSDNLELALSSPKMFLERYRWPLVIDEVQRAPGLLLEMKRIIDEQRQRWVESGSKRELMYVLTGSCQFELQQGVCESLAGRVAVMDMPSMTQMEAQGTGGALFEPSVEHFLSIEKQCREHYVDRRSVFERIFRGGMPDVVTSVSERSIYFKSYVNTYIEKDVRKLVAAGNELQFRKFLTYLALRTAQQLNFENMAQDLGMDSATCKRWLSILVASGIVFMLEPFMANMSKRIVKSPKLYFTDTGLCSYLCRWQDAEMVEDCAMGGAFFETFVVSEIVKGFYNSNMELKNTLFYYRDTDKKEIDILYVRDGTIFPIEIKKGIAPTKPARNFKVLEKYSMPIGTGFVIDCTDRIIPLDDAVWSLPVTAIGL